MANPERQAIRNKDNEKDPTKGGVAGTPKINGQGRDYKRQTFPLDIPADHPLPGGVTFPDVPLGADRAPIHMPSLPTARDRCALFATGTRRQTRRA